VRLWVAILVLAACSGGVGPDQLAHDPMGGVAECASDADCVGAASSCCMCPTFALPASSGWGAACAQTACDPAPSCAEVRPACEQGACVLACAPLACALSCAGGFAVDAAGCEVCACAAADNAPPECTVDADCAEVPADCCGCAKGGAEAAIPAADVAAHAAALMCPPQPACPGVDVCTPGTAARCEAGRCALDEPGAQLPPLPAGACGRPDLPACPAGQICTLNTSEAAETAGVGVCAP
jgi:hypothetical protein